MGQTNRICKTCGKAYYYCSNCDKSISSPQWMLMWDTENCKTIFETVSNYAQGIDSKEVARKKLEKCDLKMKYAFNKNIARLVDEIMAKDSVHQETVAPKVTEPNEDTTKKGRLFPNSEKKTEEK